MKNCGSLTGLRGIVVGCDHNQEWLLPWWWRHYAKHNAYPVAFMDFGLSKTAAKWCQKRGQHIPMPPHDIPLHQEETWKDLSPLRSAWFKKPFACLRAPFPLACWIDLDCEIRGPLDVLFHALALGADLALAPDIVENLRPHTNLLPKETIYNTGVMPFRQGAPILRHWAQATRQENDRFLGDQDVLSWLIHQQQPPFVPLPSIYNWHAGLDPNAEALIIHYAGDYKKSLIGK